MNKMLLFQAFLINSFLSGMIGLLFLAVKRIFAKRLSCIVTYYISIVITMSAAFPLGLLISNPIKNMFSDRHTVTDKAAGKNVFHSDHTLFSTETTHIIFCVWLIISVLLLCSIVVRYIKLMRDIDRWKIKSDLSSSALKGVPVYSCKIICTPMLVGFVKRELIIPEAVNDRYALDLICMHEAVHHKRNDILIKAVVLTICAFNWFNPFLWLLAKDNAEDCEASCDLSAKRTMCENDRRRYCTLLLSLAKQQNKKMLPISSFSSSYRTVSRRVNVVLNSDHDKKTSAFCLLSAICILLVSAVIITAYNAPVVPGAQTDNADKSSAENNITVNGQSIRPTQINIDDNEIIYRVNSEKSDDNIAYAITVDDHEMDCSINVITDK